MAFTLVPKTQFTAPVEFRIPADNGKTEKISFSVVFKLLSAEQVKDLNDRLAASGAAVRAELARREADPTQEYTPIAPAVSDRDVINEVLVGFGPDLKGEDKQPLEFTSDNLDALLQIHGAAGAIVESFFKHHFKEPAKN